MVPGYNWSNEKLFFFDKEQKRSRQKRQKRPIDSLPITLLRDVRPGLAVPGGAKAELKHRKISFINEGVEDIEKQNEQTSGISQDDQNIGTQQTKKKKQQIDYRTLELDDYDDEDTQKFLYEEAKFSAPSLLAQIEKFMIILMKFRRNQQKEIEELHEEIEAVYGEPWNENVFDERTGIIELPDELYDRLCSDFEELAFGTIFTKREWQTSVYREMAALHELRTNADFMSLASSPDGTVRFLNEKLKNQAVEVDKTVESDKKEKMQLNVSRDKDGRNTASNSDNEIPPILSLQRESKTSVPILKPKTRAEKYRYFQDKDKEKDKEKGKIPNQKINISAHESAQDDDIASSKTWEVNYDKTYLLLNQGQPFLPGSVINFSMTSQTCRDKGWIARHDGTEDLEHKSVLEWARVRLRQAIKQKEEEQTKAKLVNHDNPLVVRNYGDSKRETTIKYKQGVSWAKFLSKKKNETQKRFLTILPDGTSTCYYPSGRLAVITSRSKNQPGYYTMVFSDTANAKMLACFTPTGKGCCNHSDIGGVQYLVTNKQALFFDKDGTPTKKWKWAYGKLMNPETIQLSDCISVRCVSHTSATIQAHIEGETAKFQVALTPGATEPDLENLGFLMTGEQFTSIAASQSQQQKRRMTREERKARNSKKESSSKNMPSISQECLAERTKELEEKFPERKDIETDAPFLMELYRLQRRVKTVVFDWLEYYRMVTGISRPSKVKLLMKKKQRQSSANSLPGALPSTEELRMTALTPRAPSAPPISKLRRNKQVLVNMKSSKPPSIPRPKSTGASMKEASNPDFKEIKIDVPPKTADSNRNALSLSPVLNSLKLSESSTPRTPRPLLLPKEGCPVALRHELREQLNPQCRCDKRRMPNITDMEYDIFLTERVPRTQLMVISIVSSRFPRTKCDDMLDELYYERNKTHSFPCSQSRYEPYRLLRYDMATACNRNEVPLLLRRHNVAPGMFLMYVGGRLLFADHIFNGYGNAKRDFLKQVMKTQKDSMSTNSLALDFRFHTTPSRNGPRTAWGGQIGTPVLVTLNEHPSAYGFEIDEPNNDSTREGRQFPALPQDRFEIVSCR
eukprot:gene6085-6788_t